MSFLGGAECSTGANPLAQFTKHTQNDTSLQRDRLVGRGPGGLQEGMRSQGVNAAQDGMMNDFVNQPTQLPMGPGPASPFAMEQMRRELERVGPQRSSSASPNWAMEFDGGIPEQMRAESAMHAQKTGRFSPAEFAKFAQANGQQRTASPLANSGMMNGYQRPMGMGYMGGMGMGMGMGMMHQPMMGAQAPVQMQGKGKERMVELDDNDWEAQFAQLDAHGNVVADEALDREANAAVEAELDQLDRSVLSETDHFGDFESIWRGIQAETQDVRNLAAQEEQINMHMGDYDQWEGFDSLNTHGGFNDPQLGNYIFEEDNLFRTTANPYEEGLKIMAEGGNLSLAALAFEAAVQRDPQHVQAWTKLGGVQAQNEKESPAIRALEQAIKLDADNLEAIMGLAVSYTNEGYDSTAYRTLEQWISRKYPQLIEGPSTDADLGLGFMDRQALHEKVTDLYIKAAQLSPSGEQMDPDVQVGLGVLFYAAEEYDKAVDCFEAALASTETGTTNQRDQLHLLWNRLGATLANSGRSEEAIDAYSRALEIRPNFVRARYNLGVSCINIGCYEEAAQHLLGALAMHKVVESEGREKAKNIVGDDVDDADLDRMIQQNQSTNLYDTLRRVFTQMNRRDLSEKVGPGMDINGFRKEFEF